MFVNCLLKVRVVYLNRCRSLIVGKTKVSSRRSDSVQINNNRERGAKEGLLENTTVKSGSMARTLSLPRYKCIHPPKLEFYLTARLTSTQFFDGNDCKLEKWRN